MVRKNEVVGIAIVMVLFFVLIAYSQRENTSLPRPRKYQIDLEDIFKPEPNAKEVPISEILSNVRRTIKSELYTYDFPHGAKLNNFSIETGGQPIRTIIITTWRSGSTFLGDVLNAVPGNYYHYEPLLNYGIVQIRGPPLAESAISNLKSLLSCDYTNLEDYLSYGMSHLYLFTHNTRLWNECERFPEICWNTTFLNSICKLFPFQSLKTVRLRLWLAEELLKDKLLNVKVVLLVRDPRGTLQSRKHRDWCPGEPDCDQPNNVCADMVSDYAAARSLKKRYPKRFRALRYEDLSMNPYKHIQGLFKFLGLYYNDYVKMFLDSHTKMDAGGVSSTFRDSKSAPFHWKMDLNLSEVQYIEENCDDAMKLWGYVRTKNVSNLKYFDPLTTYKIK